MIRTKTILAGLLMLCGMARFAPAMGQQTIETHQVRNYYYLHDTIPQTAQEQFDRYFGPAAFMGKGGEPTPIDFSRELVIAKVFPLSSKADEWKGVRLLLQADSILVLHCCRTEGKQLTYTIRPFILLSAPVAYSHLPLTEEADSLCASPQFASKMNHEGCQDTVPNRVLIIWYDSKTGKKPLLRAVRRKRCKLIYDYEMLSGIAISIPQHADKRQMMEYFNDVKGVLSVQEDRKVTLYSD